jgi:predicted PurR-regulated permease PerM
MSGPFFNDKVRTAEQARTAERSPQPDTARRALVSVLVVLGVLLVVALVWIAIDVLLLVFAGLLLATFVRTLSDLLEERTSLRGRWALGAVLVSLLGILVVGGALFAPEVATQVEQLGQRLPQAAERAEELVRSTAWGGQLLEQLPANLSGLLAGQWGVLSRATGFFSTTLGVLANLGIVLFVGVYVAVDPEPYRAGLLRLVPISRRERALQVLAAVHHAMRWWLFGQLLSMTLIGTATAIGLSILGVPLALALGLLTALLTFIPFLGPLLSVVPATLLAFVQSPTLALYVVALYAGVQFLESNFVTPLVQERAVSLPPALTIAAQVLAGILLGALGVLLATPLTAVALVLVRMLYVEDILGDRREDKD